MIPPSPTRCHGRPSTRASNCTRVNVTVFTPSAGQVNRPWFKRRAANHTPRPRAPAPSGDWPAGWQTGTRDAGGLHRTRQPRGPVPFRYQRACPVDSPQARSPRCESLQQLTPPGGVLACRSLELGAVAPAGDSLGVFHGVHLTFRWTPSFPVPRTSSRTGSPDAYGCPRARHRIGFSGWALDHVDPTQRITHVAMQAKVDASEHLGSPTEA